MTKILIRLTILITLLLVIFIVFIPVAQFEKDMSTVVKSYDGRLVGAKIASDEQWRFPSIDSLPETYQLALLHYEDKRFYLHNGIDVLRLSKALYDNLRAGEILSGASTITMQLSRMYLDKPNRSVPNKILEMLVAWKTELFLSKEAILRMYISNAPFGGNIIGAETASWRYFNKSLYDLSWAEASTLAVLPRSPGLIHPGRNRQDLYERRNELLLKLLRVNVLDSIDFELSVLESLPEVPYPLSQQNIHLVDRMRLKGKKNVTSFLDIDLQDNANKILLDFNQRYRQNGINNLATLIVENNTGRVLCYIGNVGHEKSNDHEVFVDMVGSGRSSGSILKPLLFAQSLDEGTITTKTLLADIPGNISGYRPRNFNRGYDGAVEADLALIRSLNIPMVYLLRELTIDKFLYKLNDIGFKQIDKTADHYGLPLVLGGADVTLWELVSVYASMARVLNHYNDSLGHYYYNDFHSPVIEMKDSVEYRHSRKDPYHFSAGSVWLTFNTMARLERPDDSGAWEQFSSSRTIAWKTGTSFGFKDAWSVGVSRDYTVGVWVGNASGEGRNGLTGIQAAAPVLFRLFELLPESPWFEEPSDDLKYQEVCRETGFPFGVYCETKDTLLVPYISNATQLCPYHQIVKTDAKGDWRLDDNCLNDLESRINKYLVLPPLMEHFYAIAHPEYRVLPPYHVDCKEKLALETPMAFVYPANPSRISIPIEFSGEKGRVVFRIAHRKPDKTVYWYVNSNLLGTTVDFHELGLDLPEGSYELMVLDEDGFSLTQKINIVE